ncbi:MAG TPA: 3-dehydroquinate synthase [bacterium]|nr:3-dehydroquinate synthase [bacterium]
MRNIVLIGFMGTGKSEVGKLLARRLGWTFIDTDRRVEARERATIAQIFSRRGEHYFRESESRVIAEMAGRRDTVVATGGGAVLRPENMMHLRRHGWVVSLVASADVLQQRLSNGKNRPLLRGDVQGSVARLLDQRRPLYRDADLLIDVSQGSPAKIVEAIVSFMGKRERRVVAVRLEGRSYPVYVGDGILPLLPVDLDALRAGRKVAVVSHRAVLHSAGRQLVTALRGWGYEVTTIEVPAGEESKSLAVAARILTRLARERFDRHSTVLALGGGVVGDLAGFVAATYMRGVRLVQAPTTLLAMVDSSIGGKTGVNHAGVKNLVGAFFQPGTVVADVHLLSSLPDRELRSGLAEIIKTAVIGDAVLFEYLEQHLSAILRRDTEPLIEVVARCAAFKARVVEADEMELGERRILNYGHTIGHAVEVATRGGRLTHGEAIAIGMALEGKLAQRLGTTDSGTVERQNGLLARAGLPVALRGVNIRAFWRALALDKKRLNGVLRAPLLVGIGEVRHEQEVPNALLQEVLSRASGARRLRAKSQPAR